MVSVEKLRKNIPNVRKRKLSTASGFEFISVGKDK